MVRIVATFSLASRWLLVCIWKQTLGTLLPHEWRTFFERAGAKGALEVHSSQKSADRWERKKVVKYLGCDIAAVPESNDGGYTLLDFHIKPSLPSSDAPQELKAALAAWLEDGFRVLKGTGKRKATYTYRSRYACTGSKFSAWVDQLSELAWVPCDDDRLRCPQDVLDRFDPARDDAPVAKLSSEFLAVLDQEGVKFGTTVPEATSLRRLSAMGSQLDAAELAKLLSECREQATTDIDRHLFNEFLQDLRLPTSNNRRRHTRPDR